MTSTRLTQQNRSREWAAALRALLPTDPIARTSRQLVARIQHDSQYIHPVQSSHGILAGSPPPRVGLVRDPLTHTGAGGWVLRSGCADPFPARPCLGGPEAARRGGLTPPLRAPSSPALPNAIDLPRRERVGESAERDETLPPDPLRIFRRPGDTSPAVLPSSPPWMDLIPPRLAPSWPLRWA